MNPHSRISNSIDRIDRIVDIVHKFITLMFDHFQLVKAERKKVGREASTRSCLAVWLANERVLWLCFPLFFPAEANNQVWILFFFALMYRSRSSSPRAGSCCLRYLAHLLPDVPP
jgi:hypothetical protein